MDSPSSSRIHKGLQSYYDNESTAYSKSNPHQLAPWDHSQGFSLSNFYGDKKRKPKPTVRETRAIQLRNNFFKDNQKSNQKNMFYCKTNQIDYQKEGGQPVNLNEILSRLRKMRCVHVREQGLQQTVINKQKKQFTFMFARATKMGRNKENKDHSGPHRDKSASRRAIKTEGACLRSDSFSRYDKSQTQRHDRPQTQKHDRQYREGGPIISYLNVRKIRLSTGDLSLKRLNDE